MTWHLPNQFLALPPNYHFIFPNVKQGTQPSLKIQTFTRSQLAASRLSLSSKGIPYNIHMLSGQTNWLYACVGVCLWLFGLFVCVQRLYWIFNWLVVSLSLWLVVCCVCLFNLYCLAATLKSKKGNKEARTRKQRKKRTEEARQGKTRGRERNNRKEQERRGKSKMQ